MWRRSISAVAVSLGLLLCGQSTGSPAAGSQSPVGVGPPTAIPARDFLTQAQIRARMDFANPLTDYTLSPSQAQPEPNPDCATNRPEAVESKLYPAVDQRSQSFMYSPAGTDWDIVGSVLVLEYASTAKARAAYARAKKAVREYTHYTLVCEGMNPVISDQRYSGASAVGHPNFTWRYHLLAGRSMSLRDTIATSGRRVVWVELARQLRTDLDWDSGTPVADVPTYPSRHYLDRLAKGAVAKAL